MEDCNRKVPELEITFNTKDLAILKGGKVGEVLQGKGVGVTPEWASLPDAGMNSVTYFGTKEAVENTDARNLDIAVEGNTAIAYEGDIENPTAILDGKIKVDGTRFVGTTFHINHSTGGSYWDTEDRDSEKWEYDTETGQWVQVPSDFPYSTLYGPFGMILRITDMAWREGAIMDFTMIHHDQGDWNSVDRNMSFYEVSTTGNGKYFGLRLVNVKNGVPEFDFFYTMDSGYFVVGEEATFDINGMAVVMRVDRVATAQNQVTRFRVINIGQSDADFSGVHRFTNPNAPAAWVDMDITTVETPYTGWEFTPKEKSGASLVAYNLSDSYKTAIVRVDVPKNEIVIAEFGGSTEKLYTIANPTAPPEYYSAIIQRIKIPVYKSQEYAKAIIIGDISYYKEGDYNYQGTNLSFSVEINYDGTDFTFSTFNNKGEPFTNPNLILYAGFDEETGMLSIFNGGGIYFNNPGTEKLNITIDNVKVNGIRQPHEFDYQVNEWYSMTGFKQANFKLPLNKGDVVSHYSSSISQNKAYPYFVILPTTGRSLSDMYEGQYIDFKIRGLYGQMSPAAVVEGRIQNYGGAFYASIYKFEIFNVQQIVPESPSLFFMITSNGEIVIYVNSTGDSGGTNWAFEINTSVNYIAQIYASSSSNYQQDPNKPSINYNGGNYSMKLI